MKKKLLLVAASVAACAAANANTVNFDITYNDAEGDSGSAIVTAQPIGNGEWRAESGTFTMAAGPYAGFVGALQPITGHGLWNGNGVYGSFTGGYEFTAYGGTDLGFDDLIGKVGSTYSLSWWGMMFNDPTFPRIGGTGLVFDPSTSGGQGYANNFGGPAYGGFNGYNNQPWYDGPGATITVTNVPDGGMTVALLGGALLGLQAIRRKLAC